MEAENHKNFQTGKTKVNVKSKRISLTLYFLCNNTHKNMGWGRGRKAATKEFSSQVRYYKSRWNQGEITNQDEKVLLQDLQDFCKVLVCTYGASHMYCHWWSLQ